MTAAELLEALRAIPGAKALAAGGNGIAESRMVAGIEVARMDSADDKLLRKAWRERTKGGPTPLLMLTDAPDETQTLLALGPTSPDGPIRIVGSEDLFRVFERLPQLAKLHAVRELAEELDRLDRTGVSGLHVRGLGSEYLYRERLRKDARWKQLAELTADLPADWRPIFQKLDYEIEQLPARGYLLRAGDKRTAVLHALADPSAFAKFDAEGRPPEGALIADCLREEAPFGILASGGRLRLFEAAPESGSAVARYLELDATSLGEDDRPLLGLLAPEYLAHNGLTALLREARDFGTKLRQRLDKAIRQDVLPPLSLELGRWAKREGLDTTDDAVRHDLEAAALTFVFRALFILYAESASHLPIRNEAYRPHSLTQIVQDANKTRDKLSERSTTLWNRVTLLVKTLRDGNPAMSVPAYNGALFSADGFEGARTLDTAELPDAAIGPALAALALDTETGTGFDFSGLEIGHLGHIYEGLLSLRLSVADRPYRYDAKTDRYVEASGDPEVEPGDLLWLTDEGGRKGGGVYYTPEALVRHLVRRGVVPAFERHLDAVRETAQTDPEAAARKLFEFRVLDPACGSAHFLVAVVDELADLVAQFLAATPLPAVRRRLDDLRAGAGETYGIGIEDVSLLRRVVLKACVYGVDLSPMGAEIAKISLWLASFVPGLSLSYLDHNVKVGNSLIGVVDEAGFFGFMLDILHRAIDDAREASLALLATQDRTPDEVEASKRADRDMHERVAKAHTLLDLWVADPLGLIGARDILWGHAEDLDKLEHAEIVESAVSLARQQRAFHWPLEFPEVFASGGFESVVGNPPWEEITLEELAFYARYSPGLRGLAAAPRTAALAELKASRPQLEGRYEAELAESKALRSYFAGETGYSGSAGDPDLYKFFCQRYRRLLAAGAALAVVLPRSAFSAKGSTDFRQWLLTETTVQRLDFILNSGRWAFDAEPRYTVGLLVTATSRASADTEFVVAGVADSAAAFANQSAGKGIPLTRSALGENLEVPLLPSKAAADLLVKIRGAGKPFALGTGRWRCFPVGELHETLDKKLWEGAESGRPLWKGESFDQFDPRGTEARICPESEAVWKKVRKPRPGADSLLGCLVPVKQRAMAVAEELEHARAAFRDVTRATDSRTVRSALVPPKTFLTNKAPYLAFVAGTDLDRACCVGLMNSLAFDWQARRFVETNMNFFILEGLRLPQLDENTYDSIAQASARLSSPDDRFADFAASTNVDIGPLSEEERTRLRAEIDALVAHAWGLTDDDLEVVFSDFTTDAVAPAYRERVRARLREL